MWFSRRCLCYCLMENLFWSLNDRHIEHLSTKIVLSLAAWSPSKPCVTENVWNGHFFIKDFPSLFLSVCLCIYVCIHICITGTGGGWSRKWEHEVWNWPVLLLWSHGSKHTNNGWDTRIPTHVHLHLYHLLTQIQNWSCVLPIPDKLVSSDKTEVSVIVTGLECYKLFLPLFFVPTWRSWYSCVSNMSIKRLWTCAALQFHGL